MNTNSLTSIPQTLPSELAPAGAVGAVGGTVGATVGTAVFAIVDTLPIVSTALAVLGCTVAIGEGITSTEVPFSECSIDPPYPPSFTINR